MSYVHICTDRAGCLLQVSKVPIQVYPHRAQCCLILVIESRIQQETVFQCGIGASLAYSVRKVKIKIY